MPASSAFYVVGLAATVESAGYAGKVLAVIWPRALGEEPAGLDAEEVGTRRIAPLMRPPDGARGGRRRAGVLVVPLLLPPGKPHSVICSTNVLVRKVA